MIEKNHLHLARVIFDEDIIVSMANPTVSQLLPLWRNVSVIPGSVGDTDIDLRALQKTGILINGCGLPAMVFPTASPWFLATYELNINELIYSQCDIDLHSNVRFLCDRHSPEDRQQMSPVVASIRIYDNSAAGIKRTNSIYVFAVTSTLHSQILIHLNTAVTLNVNATSLQYSVTGTTPLP
jgi:hypothetical protein